MTSSLTAEASSGPTTPIAVQAQGALPAKKPSEGLSFSDLLDVINPLQHIPVIGTVYRELTGDTISPAAAIAGDALYGGVIGLASSVVNQVIEATTGNDIGGHIWATVFGDDSDVPERQTPTKVADATPAASTAPSAAPQSINGATAPVTPLNGPSSFFQGLQAGTHHAKAVPLSTTVPVNDPRNPVNSQVIQPAQATSGASALLQAQGPNGALSAQANQATALGTSGIGASVSTPPPAIAAAPPPPNTLAAPAVQGNIADKMMQGLDAYKTLALQQEKPASATAPSADTGVSPAALIN